MVFRVWRCAKYENSPQTIGGFQFLSKILDQVTVFAEPPTRKSSYERLTEDSQMQLLRSSFALPVQPAAADWGCFHVPKTVAKLTIIPGWITRSVWDVSSVPWMQFAMHIFQVEYVRYPFSDLRSAKAAEWNITQSMSSGRPNPSGTLATH